MSILSVRRAGFTLIEVMLSMTLMLFILGIATQTFQRQSMTITQQSGRLEAQQTAQFTLATLDRQLRLAGLGAAQSQPRLVQADSMAITFNANLVSSDTGDATAASIDKEQAGDKEAGLWTSAFSADRRKPLPSTDRLYPETTYVRSDGSPSGAETISFWLARDSARRGNEYILFRSVNGARTTVVATGIIRNPRDTVFQYFKSDGSSLAAIPATSLPLYHVARLHGSSADTGKPAAIDEIRAVRIRLTTVFHDRKADVFRRLDMTIPLLNAGTTRAASCGAPPDPPGYGNAHYYPDQTTGEKVVYLQWYSSYDEENDFVSYALYKRRLPSLTFGRPFAVVPASSRRYEDSDVSPGLWIYGVAAQDCTPSSSPIVALYPVNIR